MSTKITSVAMVNSTVDGTTVGATTPETGAFTELSATQGLNVAGALIATGTAVTAPTAAVGDNSTNVATTAWVTRALGSTVAALLASDGYAKWPVAGSTSPFVLQWGTAYSGSTGDLTVTFTETFQNALFQVLVTSLDFGPGATRNVIYITGQSTSGFTAATGSSSIACSWFAVGY